MGVGCVLLYLAIKKNFEPMLLVGIGFGVFIINVPGAHAVLYQEPLCDFTLFDGSQIYTEILAADGVTNLLSNVSRESVTALIADPNSALYGMTIIDSVQTAGGGLFYYVYKGVDLVLFPPIIFLGIGAMTDFGPLIANPKTMLLGAAAQLGIFLTFLVAILLPNFDAVQAAAIAIIGGADGPTAIYVASKLAPELVPIIAIAAYSYMALIPVIQPPLMRLLTTKKERQIRMEQLRPVSKLEKIIFPIAVTGLCGLLLPSALPLLGMLMLGNLFKESGVVPRLADTASNSLINIVSIFLGLIVGTKAYAPNFLNLDALFVICLGLVAFMVGTIGGLLLGKLMCVLTKGKVNPLIGAAGVSAVPMAARVAQKVGQEEDPQNYLLMHAMGPNVAGVIGSAVAAGVLLAIFG
ncbi:MAG: sodium ion-translocating decarboxylase subunit beta [Clostridia bacterium]|nr:sodium ion-translocating decarboxylase subunit beta [Clostridia bacterium]